MAYIHTLRSRFNLHALHVGPSRVQQRIGWFKPAWLLGAHLGLRNLPHADKTKTLKTFLHPSRVSDEIFTLILKGLHEEKRGLWLA